MDSDMLEACQSIKTEGRTFNDSTEMVIASVVSLHNMLCHANPARNRNPVSSLPW